MPRKTGDRSRISWRRSVRIGLATVGLGLALCAVPDHALLAKDQGTWAVKGKLLGKPDKKSEDVSGIACATPQGFPRACVVIDDNSQAAQFVTVNDGDIVVGASIPLIDNSFEGKALELDGEGVAYADGFFYVIGSHGHPRDSDHKLDPVRDAAKIKARIAAASQIVRFRAGADGAVSAIGRTAKLRAIMAAEPALAPYLDRRLDNNGLTIEGVAIRQGRILVGFREPTLSNGRAAVLSVAIEGVFGNAPPDARLYRLPLGEGRGVRDLAVFGHSVLVLAGPATSDPGPAAIYRWDGASEEVLLLKDLASLVGDDGMRKAEALLPLDESPSGLRVLILFDGEKEGAPASITVPGP